MPVRDAAMITASRRQILAGLACLPFASSDLVGAPRQELFLSGFSDDGGHHRAIIFDAAGTMHAQVDLPARGHGGAFSPTRPDAISFARRPGRFAVAFDRHSGRIIAQMTSPDARHFFGHGVFSPDGKLLYTTENAYESGDGIIGIWDAAGHYARLGEFPSYGIDPHDIRLMPGGRVLAVANGGIMTHPDLGRQKLNLAEMRPSLVLVDRLSGDMLQEITLPPCLHKLSIRHMAVNAEGAVGIAMQYEGPATDTPPLVFIWRDGNEPQLLSMPRKLQDTSDNYCGSAALDHSGKILAVSSPRGNFTTFWQMSDGDFLGSATMTDTCGIAGTGRAQFILSSGEGKLLVHHVKQDKATSLPSANGHWDNHIFASDS